MSRALTIAVTALLLGLAAPARGDDRVEHARQTVLDDDYQSDLPRYDSGDATAKERSGWVREANGTWRDPRRRGNGTADGDDGRWVDTREQRQPEQGSGLLQMVMWGILIVIVVLAAVWIASELTKYGGDAELPAGESQARMQAAIEAIIEKPLGDADELAMRGEFAEAIHTLLLRTLQELVRSAAVRVAPAMTSREILARVPLLADARDALAGLINAVEITHFGDEPANVADYQRCRAQFNTFAAALRASVQPKAA